MLLPSAIPCKPPPLQPVTTTTNAYILRSHSATNNNSIQNTTVVSTRRNGLGANIAIGQPLSSPPSSSDEIMPSTSMATTTTSHLLRSCRALQSMLTTPPTAKTNASSVTLGSPIRFATKGMTTSSTVSSRRIGKATSNGVSPRRPAVAAPRGLRKRRREIQDVTGEEAAEQAKDAEEAQAQPTTPTPAKRQRTLQDPTTPTAPPAILPSSSTGPQWTPADDEALVQMVLQKLRLSRGEWAGCARGLGLRGERGGKDVGRRWKRLVEGGRIGLINNSGGPRRERSR